MSDEPLAEVVRLPGTEDDLDESPVDRKTKDYVCRHRYVVLAEQDHRLYCNKERGGCGVELDPWDWIEQLTREWRNFTLRSRSARLKVERLEARVEELKRQEANVKARLRRALERLESVGPAS